MDIKKRLNKALSHAGIASRRKADEIIFSRRVKINGQICDKPQTMVDINKDKIEVDNTPLPKVEEKKYFILNKPLSFHCSNKRKGKEKLVIDLFSNLNLRLFTVGRLDKDTTGLIFVTNDGDFSNSVIHPSNNLEKEYIAKVDQEISHDHLVTISKGVSIEGNFVKPTKVKKIRKKTIKIVVKDGRKREVRILLENANLKVLELKRTRIGSVLLGNLEIGQSRPLKKNEILELLKKDNLQNL
jgi:23S rRNA pseudouridine2605 synthase